MPQVQVAIAGRSYRMACGDGEERHLEGLAAAFDAKITEMRGAFGEIGDMRLHVMAALTLADELLELRRTVERLTAEVATARAGADAEVARVQEAERAAAEGVGRLAERVERLAKAVG